MARRNNNRDRVQKPKNPNRINKEIRVREVMLVGDDVEKGIYSIEEALKMADDRDLDLVEVGTNANPPVCKFMNYEKYLYKKRKEEKKPKSKPQKEIRFTPNTDDNDFVFKAKHAQNFLEKGHRVKAFVFFRGREKAFQDRGRELLLRFAVELEEYGIAEGMPSNLVGSKMTLFIKPKK